MTYMTKRHQNRTLFIILFVLLLILIIFASTLGAVGIHFKESIVIVLSKVPIVNKYISADGISESHRLIVSDIRFPRILLSALIGIALSGTGVIFQGIFRNPMADPYVLGVSSGAAFGASLAIILGVETTVIGFSAVALMAFAGALATTLLVYNIARTGAKTPTVTLLLAGIAVSFLLTSFISLLMTLHREQIQKIVFWTMGSVAAASWNQVIISAPIILAGSISYIAFARDLNVMLMGDDTAKSLGLEVEKLKRILLVIASVVAAAAVSVSGIIGFVGLIIPHTGRLLLGPDHRTLIPFSLLGGAIFMIITDTLARILIPPSEIPVGIITSLFGAPFFIFLLYRSKKKVL